MQSIEQKARQRTPVRLWVLVALQLALAPAAAVPDYLELDSRPPTDIYAPIIQGVLHGVGVAPAMLLPFWCGLGTSYASLRLAGGILGVLYLTLSQTAWLFVPDPLAFVVLLRNSPRDVVMVFLSLGVNVGLFTGGFLVVRRWIAELRRIEQAGGERSRVSLQFSLWHLLGIMLIAAVVLGLVREAFTGPRGPGIDWEGWIQAALLGIVLFVDALFAAWATLSPGRVAVRIMLALAVTLLLSAAYSLPVNSFEGEILWPLALGGLMFTALPTLIVIGSLVVVRSCGYRLVSRRNLTGA